VSTIKDLAQELLGQEVTVLTRTTEHAFGGLFASIDLGTSDSRLGPTVVLKDEEGQIQLLFDVSSVTPGIAYEEDEEDGEEEEEEDEDEEEEFYTE